MPPLVRQSTIRKIEGNIRECMRHYLQAHNDTLMFAVCAKCVISCISDHVMLLFLSALWEMAPARVFFAYTHACLPEWN